MSKPSVLVYLTVLLLATVVSYSTGIVSFPVSFSDTLQRHLFKNTAQNANNPLGNADNTPIAQIDPDAAESPNSAALDFLILAELAQQTEEHDLALTYYKQALALSHAPAIAQEATELALAIDASETAIDFAKRWANLSPHDLSAQLVAMTLVLPSDSQLAEHYLSRALAIAPDKLASHLSLIQSRLPEAGRLLLYQAILNLADKQRDSAEAQYLAAQGALYEQDLKGAATHLAAAFRLTPHMTKAIELQAKLIRFHDSNDEQALFYLRKQVGQLPHNHELRAFYARALIDAKKYAEAIQQLTPLLEAPSYQAITLILLGEVYHLMQNETMALKYLSQALSFPEQRAAAHYLLGEIYQKQNKLALALTHFSTISEGEYHVPAVLNSAVILNKTQQFDDALELLRSAEPTDFQEQKQLLLLEVKTLINAKNIVEANELLGRILKNLPEDPDFLLEKRAIELKHEGVNPH